MFSWFGVRLRSIRMSWISSVHSSWGMDLVCEPNPHVSLSLCLCVCELTFVKFRALFCLSPMQMFFIAKFLRAKCDNNNNSFELFKDIVVSKIGENVVTKVERRKRERLFVVIFFSLLSDCIFPRE